MTTKEAKKRTEKAIVIKEFNVYNIYVSNIYNEKENILLATLDTKKDCIKYAKDNNLKITKINNN